MSEDHAQPPSSAGSPSSSPESLPADPLLERLLGAISKALDGLTRATADNRKLSLSNRVSLVELDQFVRRSATRHEQRLADLQVAITDFLEHVRIAHGIETVVIDDARKALDASKRSFDKALEDSQKIVTQRGEVEFTDSITREGIRVRWVTMWGAAKAGVPVAVKIGGLAMAIAAAIYKLWEGVAPFWHGWWR